MSSQPVSPASPLPRSTLFFYGIADLPVMMAIMPMMLYLNRFYTGDMGLGLAAVANIMLFARVFDVVSDPLIGYLSDRTKSRWGRRRPWMAASLPFLMLGVYKVFLPPEGIDIWYLFTWMMVLWMGWTMLMIPYYAWAAELSTDYNERTRITGWRAMMGSVGALLAQVVPFLAMALFAFGGAKNVMNMVGIVFLVLMPICVTLTIVMVKENDEIKAPPLPLFAGLRIMWRNGPFKRLLLGFVLSSTGLAVMSPLYIFFIEFVLEEPQGNVIYMLLINYIASMIGIPCWVWLSKYIGKHRAWIAGFLIVAAISPMYLFLGPGDFWWMTPGTIIIGFGTGSFMALPNSMKADVIDLDTARSGQNRAAFFFSSWSLITKMASSLGGWLALQMLALVGFDAAIGAENTPTALMGLQFAYAILPGFIFVAAAIVIWRYPINQERQQRIRAAIDRRQIRRARMATGAAGAAE